MRNKFYVFAALVFVYLQSMAQNDVPTPAKQDSQSVYLMHATVHTGSGEVLEDATIGFQDGKIIFLQASPSFKTDETMGKVIDCTGKHIYPGIIALATKLGLSEVEAVRATNDYEEVGSYNPNVRTIVSYNTDSRVTPTVRSNGVLYAQIAPVGGTISGTSSVVQLDAWNWEDALIAEDGIWLNWPSMVQRRGWWAEPKPAEVNKEYDKQVREIKNYLSEAREYASVSTHDKANLRFEAMSSLFDKSKKLFIRVNRAQEILDAIRLAEEYSVSIVIVGGTESWMVADELAKRSIPVVLSEIHDLPASADADIDQPFKTPALLQKAGVTFCISIPNGFWQERNLAFQAGTGVAYGLTKEQALSAITSSPAKICGVGDSIGILKVGMTASLIVSTGDLLDMRTSQIEYAFIQGRMINLDNKQKELNTKFMNKYGLH